MKRIICIILVLLMCLALISCGKKPVQDETLPVTDDTSAETENTDRKIGSFNRQEVINEDYQSKGT